MPTTPRNERRALQWLPRTLTVALLLIAGATPAQEHTLERGMAAYNAGNYRGAVSVFRHLAHDGDSTAQLLLGLMHSEGLGTQRDVASARFWYRRSAEQGDARGQFMLGLSFVEDRESPDAQSAGVAWIERAAGQGNVPAQQFLALSYQNGWFGLSNVNRRR